MRRACCSLVVLTLAACDAAPDRALGAAPAGLVVVNTAASHWRVQQQVSSPSGILRDSTGVDRTAGERDSVRLSLAAGTEGMPAENSAEWQDFMTRRPTGEGGEITVQAAGGSVRIRVVEWWQGRAKRIQMVRGDTTFRLNLTYDPSGEYVTRSELSARVGGVLVYSGLSEAESHLPPQAVSQQTTPCGSATWNLVGAGLRLIGTIGATVTAAATGNVPGAYFGLVATAGAVVGYQVAIDQQYAACH